MKNELIAQIQRQSSETEKLQREKQDEKLVFDTKMASREATQKEWTMKLMEEQYEDYSKLLTVKLQEQENNLKTLLADSTVKQN